MQYFGYSVNIIFVIVALLLFQRIFLFHVQFVNGMNTSYVQIRNELASEQLIKVQFQVAMSGRYNLPHRREHYSSRVFRQCGEYFSPTLICNFDVTL